MKKPDIIAKKEAGELLERVWFELQKAIDMRDISTLLSLTYDLKTIVKYL